MSKSAVQHRYPNAQAEYDWPGFWRVWDIPVKDTHGVRFRGDVALGRVLLGLSTTEDGAWKDAATSTQRREGKL